jgi:peptidoglycan hydrolase-like protein with peptidoglycan-binding domain
MYGTDVSSWQRLLTDREFPLGEIDGFWGAKSEAALQAFQRSYGLNVTGILGAEAAKALIEGFPQPVD